MATSSIRHVGGQVAIKVFLLDNSMKTLLVDTDATVADVCRYMVQKLGIHGGESAEQHFLPCFSLHECLDGVTISKPLANAIPVMDIVSKWPATDIPRFVFQIKLFLESLKNSNDPALIRILYIQAVYNVICGIFPVTVDEAVSLAALQVQQSFGSHKPDVHKAGYLKTSLRGLIPASLMGKKSTPEEWEAIILARHSMLSLDAQKRPAILYCAVLATREYYGCAFYGVKQKFSQLLPQVLVIGINGRGIYLMDPENGKKVIERYTLAQLYRWGYEPDKSFTYQVKTPAGTPGQTFEFLTLAGHHMSQLLTEYATQILAEMTQRQQQQQQQAPPQQQHLPSTTTTTTATLPSTTATTPARKSSVDVAPAASSSTTTTTATTTTTTTATATAVETKTGLSAPPTPSRSTTTTKTSSEVNGSSSSSNNAIGAGAGAAASSLLPPPPPPPTLPAPPISSKESIAPEDAAVRIQSLVRGNIARKGFDAMIAKLEDDLRKDGKI